MAQRSVRLWHSRGQRQTDKTRHGCSSGRLATPFPRMVSLFSACYDLAFCISGTLRLTDWKPVSQTLLVFSGTFSYLVRSIISPSRFPDLLIQQTTTPTRPPPPGEEMIPPGATKTHVDVSPCGPPNKCCAREALGSNWTIYETKKVREKLLTSHGGKTGRRLPSLRGFESGRKRTGPVLFRSW